MKQKYLVLTIVVGDDYQQMAQITHHTIKAYADKIGADFLSIDKSNCSTPHWMKFEIFNLLNQYDRIIYLDTDLIIRDDCPNLFDIVPDTKLGLFNEAPFTIGRQMAIYESAKAYDIDIGEWDGRYFNTGVIVISRIHKYLFRKPKQQIANFYEQSYLNLQIMKQNIEIYDLEYQFNRMTCVDQFTGEERLASYIIHYAGFPDVTFIKNLISKDIATWENDCPTYEYQRHIIIDIQGGLGDQVDTEPSIRYMMDYIYPGADINVLTHFPRLFSHLDLPTFEHGTFIPIPDTPYYKTLNLPGPDTINWALVSNLLCHTIDYISIALLHRTLPILDKQIQLEVEDDDVANLKQILSIDDLSELVLVHPGRHWESKTFPQSWWQAIIEGLNDVDLPVCLIGKENGNVGTVDIDLPDGVLDTRNLLDLGSYIALLSEAKVLISNDSSPIHIAGAFDNEIILIPTCKHPDHLLPYRNGRQDYKAVALYKTLLVDDFDTQPTNLSSRSGEFVNGNILDYLPDVDVVISEVVQRYNGD